MKPQVEDIRAVIEAALQKYEAGRAEHGELDLSTDPRNFTGEAIEEMLDAINYLCFQIIRLRMIRSLRDAK